MELHEKWREQKTWGENLWKDKWLTPGDKGSKQMRGGDKVRQQILFWQTSASDHFKQMTNGWEEVVDRWEVTNRWQEIMFWQISLPQPSQTGEKRVRGCDKQMTTNFDKPLSAAAAVVAPSSSSFNHLHSLKSQPFLKCVRLGGRYYFLSAGLNLQNLEHPFLKKHLSTRCSHQVWQGPCIGPPSSELSNGSREG